MDQSSLQPVQARGVGTPGFARRAAIGCLAFLLGSVGAGTAASADDDCNGNGVPDATDIAQGTSLDLNGDGIPDECGAPLVSGLVRNPSRCSGYYITEPRTWFEAEAIAQSLGGHLVTVSDAMEQTFLLGMLAEAGFQGGSVWIGLSDVATEGSFVWASGEPVVFTDWSPGEPNDFGGEDFAEMSIESGRWNDLPEGVGLHAIVEVPLGTPLAFDCNCNGVNDFIDLVQGVLTDCDGDLLPDTCALAGSELLFDCNGNGVYDACDVASGTSLDIDGNGQPDECQPDLTISMLSATPISGALNAGHVVVVAATIENVGQGPVNGGVETGLWFSPEPRLVDEAVFLGTAGSGFSPAGIAQFAAQRALPILPGEWWLIAEVDFFDAFGNDLDPANNTTVIGPIIVVDPGPESCAFALRATGGVPGIGAIRAAYDEQRGRTVLFGGDFANGGGLYDHTWEWDGTSWTEALGDGPAARNQHEMTYDSVRGRVLVFGGSTAPFGQQPVNELWAWDGTSWELVSASGISPRLDAMMAFDRVRDRLVVFGGRDQSGALGDTWEFDGTGWTQVAVTGPTPRASGAMVFDEERGRIVLFGGQANFNYDSTTWEWDGSSWTSFAAPGPEGREINALVWDPVRRRVVLYGGQQCCSLAQPTIWEWDGAAWTARAEGSLGVSGRFAMVHDRDRGRAVLLAPGTPTTWELSSGALITAQPGDAVAAVGRSATFTVEVAACDEATYLWEKDGRPLKDGPGISGAATTTLSLTGLSPSDAGAYRVRVVDGIAESVSDGAILMVKGGVFADLNGDAAVDAADLAVLLGSWGSCTGCAADLDGDGEVGAADLALLLGAWG